MDASVEGARRGGVQRRGGEVQWRCRGDGEVGGDFPSLTTLTLNRIRFSCWWITTAHVNIVVRALITTSFYSAMRQGSTNHIRVGRPRSGRRSNDPIGRWAYWWRSTNILPLDLTTIFLFHIIYFCSFHYRLAHRACFIVTVYCR